jgi:hypothetical protein
MKNLIFVLLAIFLSSCFQDKAPENVISEEDMVEIIIDMHLTDGLFTITKVRKDLAQKDSLNYYNEIFLKYGYTRQDFDTSVYYYSKNINEYDKIYQEVLNRLNEMETELRQETKGKFEKERQQVDN